MIELTYEQCKALIPCAKKAPEHRFALDCILFRDKLAVSTDTVLLIEVGISRPPGEENLLVPVDMIERASKVFPSRKALREGVVAKIFTEGAGKDKEICVQVVDDIIRQPYPLAKFPYLDGIKRPDPAKASILTFSRDALETICKIAKALKEEEIDFQISDDPALAVFFKSGFLTGAIVKNRERDDDEDEEA